MCLVWRKFAVAWRGGGVGLGRGGKSLATRENALTQVNLTSSTTGLSRIRESFRFDRRLSSFLARGMATQASEPAAATTTKWVGGQSQEEFMLKDMCILVNEADEVTGHASKKECHVFNEKQPRGLLHRAFSVFLFNGKNELMLQKRASSKITFPSVWTNTCCSHPLYGYEPSEVESLSNTEVGKAPGTINAAIRKLDHELGIRAAQVPAEEFKFQTRLHYCAKDVSTAEDGSGWSWGEHEMDYILLIKTEEPVEVNPNPEEVDDWKYVTPQELRAMMGDKDLLWSPWFRIIEKEFLHTWWENLDEALSTSKFVDNKIHKLEIPRAGGSN
ncbi:isopentenyl-diphosphate delta-isomerase [Chloropicon primus]|uniref:isopentenyl-diphosphate Delta-isomerase n=1 Tax=Chloropicon primus TaxID=1764295 RepID=A0A5B8MQH4_9CHLO|nr:isopentenyl-diphosphate delta-isomerase [Chloropicon primus]UPR00851.1 isopentenyl-diphosphate delta-isomerase [Chloropicon primus]|eukprot:QDZ21640.1 isopentenyl-diphosphate delta-isomerase [Chloropicon primus]